MIEEKKVERLEKCRNTRIKLYNFFGKYWYTLYYLIIVLHLLLLCSAIYANVKFRIRPRLIIVYIIPHIILIDNQNESTWYDDLRIINHCC